jgi:hypothetical protein
MDGILQIERLGDGKGVGGVMIHVVTFGNLGRPAMATAIMGDNAKTLGKEEQHLRIPVIGRERPAVVKHDGLGILRAPVLVEDFGSVCRLYKAHDHSPSVVLASSDALSVVRRFDGGMMTQDNGCDNCNNN